MRKYLMMLLTPLLMLGFSEAYATVTPGHSIESDVTCADSVLMCIRLGDFTITPERSYNVTGENTQLYVAMGKKYKPRPKPVDNGILPYEVGWRS